MELQAKARLMAGPNPVNPETMTTQPLFLPPRLVMLDCEMTGLNPRKDDLIQIAALKLELQDRAYVQTSGPEFNIFIHTDQLPTSDFARKHMMHVYEGANASKINYIEARKLLDAWLGDWRGKVSPAGDCVPTDIMFMYMKGIIDISHYDGDTPVDGTFHYEYWDMNAIKAIARQKAGTKFDRQLPRLQGDHDALVDCKNQLTEMNGLIDMLLGPTLSGAV
jgi:oligoribonuclease (3'-5' exoribonuclease)